MQRLCDDDESLAFQLESGGRLRFGAFLLLLPAVLLAFVQLRMPVSGLDFNVRALILGLIGIPGALFLFATAGTRLCRFDWRGRQYIEDFKSVWGWRSLRQVPLAQVKAIGIMPHSSKHGCRFSVLLLKEDGRPIAMTQVWDSLATRADANAFAAKLQVHLGLPEPAQQLSEPGAKLWRVLVLAVIFLGAGAIFVGVLWAYYNQ